MIDAIFKGGVVMIPIVLCSIISLAIIIERAYNLTVAKVHSPDFVTKIKGLLNSGKINEVITICSGTKSPVATIMESGVLKRSKDREQIKEAIEHAGRQETHMLNKYLGVLATIASITPLLGLLGTVNGMVKAFGVMAAQGVGDPNALAGGISEALITTVAGLVVAIPTLVAHNFFSKRITRFVMEMENTSLELLDILVENLRKIRPGVEGSR